MYQSVNIGAAGGAGVPEHVHMHVCPRWAGETNLWLPWRKRASFRGVGGDISAAARSDYWVAL